MRFRQCSTLLDITNLRLYLVAVGKVYFSQINKPDTVYYLHNKNYT